MVIFLDWSDTNSKPTLWTQLCCLMQIYIILNETGRNMNTKYVVVIAAMAVMLVAATTLSTIDSAFATEKSYS